MHPVDISSQYMEHVENCNTCIILQNIAIYCNILQPTYLAHGWALAHYHHLEPPPLWHIHPIRSKYLPNIWTSTIQSVQPGTGSHILTGILSGKPPDADPGWSWDIFISLLPFYISCDMLPGRSPDIPTNVPRCSYLDIFRYIWIYLAIQPIQPCRDRFNLWVSGQIKTENK